MRFQALKEVTMRRINFWRVTSSCMVKVCACLRGTYCLPFSEENRYLLAGLNTAKVETLCSKRRITSKKLQHFTSKKTHSSLSNSFVALFLLYFQRIAHISVTQWLQCSLTPFVRATERFEDYGFQLFTSMMINLKQKYSPFLCSLLNLATVEVATKCCCRIYMI
jgi:hypothetical protein